MNPMEGKHLLIACAWAFITTVVIAYSMVGQVLEAFGIVLLYFITFLSTGALLLIPNRET